MSSPRVPDSPLPGQRRTLPPTGVEPPPSTRDVLLHTWAGRLFIISTALKLLVALLRLWVELPRLITILSSAATIGLIVSVSYFVWRLFVLMNHRLLWRVRRKLILSYIFIGVVPSLLIVIFFLLGGVLIFMNVSAYLFKDGYDATFNYLKLATEAAASEISRAPETAAQSLTRTHRNASRKYRVLSFVYIPAAGAPSSAPADRIQVGPWEHMPAPSKLPAWLTRNGWSGTIARPLAEGPGEVELVHREAAPVVVGGKLAGYVVGDLPITDEMVQQLRDDTGVRAGAAAVVVEKADRSLVGRSRTDEGEDQKGGAWSTLFGNSVIFLDYKDWESKAPRQVSITLSYRPGELYRKLSDAQQISFKDVPLGVLAIIILLVIAGLFLIIEIVALSMGLALARSITSAIHELFMGT